MTFGQRLYNLRMEKGWSIGQLAKLSGITPHSISQMERDAHKPQNRSLQKLAPVFGIEVSDLVNEEDIYVPHLRKLALERNSYVLRFADGLYYIADDEEPTDDLTKAMSIHSPTAAKIEAAIVTEQWGEPAEAVRRGDIGV